MRTVILLMGALTGGGALLVAVLYGLSRWLHPDVPYVAVQKFTYGEGMRTADHGKIVEIGKARFAEILAAQGRLEPPKIQAQAPAAKRRGPKVAQMPERRAGR